MDIWLVIDKLLDIWEEMSFAEQSGYVLGFLFSLYLLYVITRPTKEQRLRKELHLCWKELSAMIKNTKCNPIMLRLGWSDAMTYDSAIATWPYCGGVNGSARLDFELNLAPNAGLSKAISLLTPIKRKFRSVSWADLIQMAAVVSVYTAGGPLIELDYGRVDAPSSMYDSDDEEGNKMNSPLKQQLQNRYRHSSGSSLNNKVPILPHPYPPYPDGAPSADVHIRNIFYRLGLNNRDTVALCGAHTLGRGFKDRTGVCPFSTGDQGATMYTKPTAIANSSGDVGVGMAGGCSWTKLWLQFDNSYFQRIFDMPHHHHNAPHLSFQTGNTNSPSVMSSTGFPDAENELLWLPTDQALYDSPEYRTYFLRYANSQEEFFKDFTVAYKKLSELGAKFKFVIQLNYEKLNK